MYAVNTPAPLSTLEALAPLAPMAPAATMAASHSPLPGPQAAAATSGTATPLDLPAPAVLERMEFVRLLGRQLQVARRQANCPAVMLVTLQAPEGASRAAVREHQQRWMLPLYQRLRQQLRRSDLLLQLEGGCLGVIFMDTVFSALPAIEQRLAQGLNSPLTAPADGNTQAERPSLRMGTAVDVMVNGHEPSADALVWAAEQDLHMAAMAGYQLN